MKDSNKLTYISNFKDGYTEKMAEIRSMYVNLDDKVESFLSDPNVSNSSKRTIALARTHLKSSLMYAIKSLCLNGEQL